MGLTAIVQDEMELNPFARYLFIFCNSSRSGLKVLYWDRCGFAMWYKKLEKEKFKWPSHLESDSINVDIAIVEQFLEGLNPWQVPFSPLKYEKI